MLEHAAAAYDDGGRLVDLVRPPGVDAVNVAENTSRVLWKTCMSLSTLQSLRAASQWLACQ